MSGLIEKLRVRFDAEYARQAWLARCQEFDDRALQQRLVAAVDVAIATAEPGQVDSDTDGGVLHTCVWWVFGSRHVSAQRTIHPGRADHAIYVDGSSRWSDPDAGPWLVTLDGAQLRFMPGLGFETPEAFLDWFEQRGVVRS
jgi:hypothetical protein